MTTSRLILSCACVLMITTDGTRAEGFEPGNTYHGFTLMTKRLVKEANAECLYFEHTVSGARVLKIAADDPNKMFAVAFKTVPESDGGTPHIMEHMVLNGSKHFPVKSPFDLLSQGSLRTFLNAFTGNDITFYPVASMNQKDYFNLMHVYLDAVYYPLVHSDRRIFQQEGWHYEITSRDEVMAYKGVVYNEMKGAYSNPSRELDYQIRKHLFPDNGYRYTAGGYPTEIPKLTYESALEFHRRYYHPENSYVLLHGDADLHKELSFIDSAYLSNFKRTGASVSIPLQKAFGEMKEVTASYSVPEGGKNTDQAYLSLSFVAGRNTDQELVMALTILKDVLVNQPSAPVRLALQEAGIGKEVSAEVDNTDQNLVKIVVQNANGKDAQRFRDLVMQTLRTVVDRGLNKQMVEGAVNRTEFQLREGNDAQKGLAYCFQVMPSWLSSGDPFPVLEYEKPLAKMRSALQNNYFESIVRTQLLENPHALLLVLDPKPGLEKENDASTVAELAAHKKKLSPETLDSLIRETNQLIAYQKREDSPEALATIPVLDLKDIHPTARWYEVVEQKVSGIPLLYHQEFTNNVVYARLYFDLRTLPTDLVPYAALLAEVLGKLNTQKYTYDDLDIALNSHTGGFSSRLESYLEDQRDDHLLPKMVVSVKALNSKLDKMFELVGEILTATRYADRDRLRVVVTQLQSRLDGRIRREGLDYARTRLESYYANDGMFRELTGGMSYYWFVTDLASHFDEKAGDISAALTKVASLLIRRGNMIAAVTCAAPDAPKFSEGLQRVLPRLKKGKAELQPWKFDFEKRNEGLLAASKVQYVVKGYDYKKLGYTWTGKMRVLNQVLTSDWLHNRIRVIGGAYGGFAAFMPSGRSSFSSYRDPNLRETLTNFDATIEYLETFEADEKAMTRFVIGTVARLDQPLTPSGRGDRAFLRYFEKTTRDDVQAERDAVLATTAEDVRGMRNMVADILSQNAYCVYGSEQKIQTEKSLFKNLVRTVP